VVDDELAPPGEEIGQGRLAARPIEDVALLDPDPGQLAPLPAELLSQPRELVGVPFDDTSDESSGGMTG